MMHVLTPYPVRPEGLITEADHCFFLVAFSRGATRDSESWNQCVRNLKLSPVGSSADSISKKREAIGAFATELGMALPAQWRRSATFVPTPSSRTREDGAYDPRIHEVLSSISPPLDVRCFVEQKESRPATHLADEPCTLEQLVSGYCVNSTWEGDAPAHIVVVDDIVVTGLHFRAMHSVLRKVFPFVPISGLFLARRAHELDA